MDKVRSKLQEILNNEDLVKIIVSNIIDSSRARTLVYNLRKFPHLKETLVDGTLDPEYFAKSMTHSEMSPYKIEEQKNYHHVDDSEGLVKCESCNSRKTDYTEIHTLECTFFRIYCRNCNHISKI